MNPIDLLLHSLTFPMLPLMNAIFESRGQMTRKTLVVMTIYSVLVVAGFLAIVAVLMESI